MDLVTLCPFVASKVVWQAHSGGFALTVIVKATFILQPGTSQLAPEQDPICERDRFHDEDPRRSVRIPSDVVPYKPRADVMLVGRAYAPNKQPVRSLVTRFVVGDMDKSIEVWCDRVFRMHDGQLLEGKRFTEMPLVWERASGGPDSANPVGRRFDGPADTYGTIVIGNLQPPGQFVSKRSDTFVPTCYGSIAPRWPGRTARLGRLSRSILDGAWNAQALPSDLDPSFFQAAPQDQCVGEIRANERIVLENLHPEHARLVTSLPGLEPRAVADRATGEREEIKLVGDTLWVDTDRGVCCVVWRGRMGLRHPEEAGRIAIWVDGLPMTGHVQPHESIAVMDDPPELVTTMAPKASPQASALPFVGGTSSWPQPSFVAEQPAEEPSEDDGTGTMFVRVDQLGVKAIPFEQQGNVGAPVDLPAPQPSTIATPFVAPTVQQTPAFVPDPYANERSGWAEPEPGRVEMDAAPREQIAPPPMIGPLARGEMEPTQTEKSEQTEVPADAKEKLPVDEYPIDRCGGIAARMARGKEDRYAILKSENLQENVWQKLHAHWQAEIKEEAGRGEKELMLAYDRGYVSALERERGPITAEDFKRLVLAVERGKGAETLEEMGLPTGAMMRIRRVRMEI